MRQKRIVAINDISGIGRCSTYAFLPIVSLFDIESCLVPTAILSSSTQYPDFVMRDFSNEVGLYLKQYDNNHLTFDGIFVGFLGNASVIHAITDYVDKNKDTFIFVDPIMGDNGKLYATYTNELVEGVKKICERANVITPNLTEFCALVSIPYHEDITEEELLEGCRKLGNECIVVSGIERNQMIGNYIYSNNEGSLYLREKKYPSRSGTGDVFSAIIFGGLICHMNLHKLVVEASEFIYDAIERSQELVEDEKEGLAFEGILYKIIEMIKNLEE